MPATAAKSQRAAERLVPPQIAPPLPIRTELEKFEAAAALAGIVLMPWQRLAARYITALGKSGWLYREVFVGVPRQNGKSTLLIPRIVAGLLAGEKVMHSAQNREQAREIYNVVADALDEALMRHPPRLANGQERIDMLNGGVYRIVAPSRGGARGPSNDLVIIDELREFEDFDFIAAAKPTLTVSEKPQILYVSSAGTEQSVVLNALRRRASGDNDLAFLEWSAPSGAAPDDRKAWKIANPAHVSKPTLLATLEHEYRASLESGTLSLFETEHLGRGVASMHPRLVSEMAWMACAAEIEEDPVRPAIAFNMDASGKRASAVMSWQLTNGRVACVELAEATGDPIDVERLGSDIQALVKTHSAKRVAYASWTDKDLAQFVPRAQALDGKEFAAASEKFARMVTSGQLAWDGAAHVSDDLRFTARKRHDESGAWIAVPATPERSITAILAAIRATWLASAPRSPAPRIG